MSWYRQKIAAAVLAVFLLGACGFQPLYATRADGVSLDSRYRDIEIANIPDREGQELRNALIDRLYKNGRPVNAPLLLKIGKLEIVRSGLGIRKDATATRGETEIQTTVTLVDRASDKILLKRTIRASGDYNRLNNQYATVVSERYSTDRVLEDIAEIIMTELALYYNRTPATGS